MPLCLQKHCHLTTLYADASQPKHDWDNLMPGDQGSVQVLQCCGLTPVRASIGRENPSPFDVEYGCRRHLAEIDKKNAAHVLKLAPAQFQVSPMHCLSQQKRASRQV